MVLKDTVTGSILPCLLTCISVCVTISFISNSNAENSGQIRQASVYILSSVGGTPPIQQTVITKSPPKK